MTSKDKSELELQTLDTDECSHLLASNSFGRLAMNLEDGPMIFPVNYAFIEPSIVIRTAPGSKLASAPLTVVAFEIDDVDDDHLWGWSVVAQGRAFDISTTIDEYSEELRRLPFHPWVPGNKGHLLKIDVHKLSGRRFGEIPKESTLDR